MCAVWFFDSFLDEQNNLYNQLFLHYICHAFSIQQAVVFAYGSTDDHMFDGKSKCLFFISELILLQIIR